MWIMRRFNSSLRPARFLGALLLVSIAFALCRAQQPARPAPPPPPPPEPQQTAPESPLQSGYTIQRSVDLVVLHVSVTDEHGQFVPGLKPENFRVFEDDSEQKISVVREEDVPVSMGLLIDNSGSMDDKREKVNAAALAFVKTSNPDDEAFVAHFNDKYDFDRDFTSDLGELNKALEHAEPDGSTALYDATIASLEHLKSGYRDKKVLLIVSDGEDNSSHRNLASALQEAQKSSALIYAVGLLRGRGSGIGRARPPSPSGIDSRHRRDRPVSRKFRGRGVRLRSNRARDPPPVHPGLLSDEYAQGRFFSFAARSNCSSLGKRKYFGANSNWLLRPARFLGELSPRAIFP